MCHPTRCLERACSVVRFRGELELLWVRRRATATRKAEAGGHPSQASPIGAKQKPGPRRHRYRFGAAPSYVESGGRLAGVRLDLAAGSG